MITYQIGIMPEIAEIIDLYKSSGINRPVDDYERIKKMYTNSNLIVTGWDKTKLVGIARALTDFCYCCYLSDLAVQKEYQKKGGGSKLILQIKEQIGTQSMLHFYLHLMRLATIQKLDLIKYITGLS